MLTGVGERASARFVYPVLGVAMTLSAVFCGLERSQFLSSTAPVRATVTAVAPVDSAAPADSAVEFGGLDLTVDHPRIDSWVARLTTSLKSDFEESLGRMDKYDAMITAKLDARQMPHELKYLAMIESNFNPTAKSEVGAVISSSLPAPVRPRGGGGQQTKRNPACRDGLRRSISTPCRSLGSSSPPAAHTRSSTSHLQGLHGKAPLRTTAGFQLYLNPRIQTPASSTKQQSCNANQQSQSPTPLRQRVQSR